MISNKTLIIKEGVEYESYRNGYIQSTRYAPTDRIPPIGRGPGSEPGATALPAKGRHCAREIQVWFTYVYLFMYSMYVCMTVAITCANTIGA